MFYNRPDTLFGMSFLALSIDHPVAKYYENDKNFLDFKKKWLQTGTTEEAIANAEEFGFETELFATNPLDKIKFQFCQFCLMDMVLEQFWICTIKGFVYVI